MWGSLLGLALVISLNPMLLAFILLIIARPRPVQNLFFYWAGALSVNLPLFLVPLALLHMTTGFASFADGLATPTEASSGTVQPYPIGLGVVFLTISAVMVVRPRLRERANSRASGGDVSAASLDSPAPTTGMPSQDGNAKTKAIKVLSAIQRLYERLTELWDGGALWVAFVFGMMYLPSATLVLLIDTTIIASGAGLGEQVIAAIAFVVGFLAVLEIVLISYLVAPTKTEAVLRPLHEWARTYNRQILIVFFALIGIWQLVRGFSLA